MRLSIIIPCYNESRTLEELLDKVIVAPLPQGWNKEIIVVDDGSNQETKNTLSRLQPGLFSLVHRKHNGGKGAALKDGFAKASGDYLLIQDADLEYDPADYLALLSPIDQKKAQIVFGSRRTKRENASGNILYAWGGVLVTKIFNVLFKTNLTDIATCYKVFPKYLVPELLKCKNQSFIFDMVDLTHVLATHEKIIEVPISYRARTKQNGKKLKWTDGIRAVTRMFALKFSSGENLLKLAVFGLLLLFYGSLLIHQIDFSAGDDLPRHIKNGEMILNGNFEILYQNTYSYTESNETFVNHHWLSGVVFYLLNVAFGWNGFIIFKAILLLTSFSLLFFTALRKSSFWLAAILSVPAILILAERTTLRPEIFSYFFIATFLYILTVGEKNQNTRKIYLLIPLQLLWVNLHIFFPIGIVLVGAFFLEKVVEYRKSLTGNSYIRRLITVLCAVVFVSFLNPNGIAGVLEPVRISNDIGIEVSETQSILTVMRTEPLKDVIPIFTFVAMLPFLVLSFVLAGKKRPIPFYAVAALFTVAAGLLMRRNIPLTGLIFLPAVAANMHAYFAAQRIQKSKLSPYVAAWIIGTLLVILISLGLNGGITVYNRPGLGLTPRSQDAALFLKEHSLRGPIFNNFDSGSYLIYHLFPKEKVFVDNRPEAYSRSFFEHEYLEPMQNETAWEQLLTKYNFNMVFLSTYDQSWYFHQFAFNRIRDPAWALVYADTYHLIFLRRVSNNEEIIRRFEISPVNAEEKLRPLANSLYFEDKVAAADIFNLLGMESLAAETHLRIVTQWPDKAKIWMVMGIWELIGTRADMDPRRGVEYLKKAIDFGQKTAGAYYFLSFGYYKIGDFEKAKVAIKHSLDINPSYQASLDLQKLLLNKSN